MSIAKTVNGIDNNMIEMIMKKNCSLWIIHIELLIMYPFFKMTNCNDFALIVVNGANLILPVEDTFSVYRFNFNVIKNIQPRRLAVCLPNQEKIGISLCARLFYHFQAKSILLSFSKSISTGLYEAFHLTYQGISLFLGDPVDVFYENNS